ncbi:hypothetical protein FHS34_002353 [Streptomyces echinatus]|uniref:Uncharacterized protein n=1 Tax=Streptomyces echinatus TaxID=67293 RepID=A0A7W9UQ01_9ACTN|nr:hypothetical protein [Streptomyces echinatus]
MEQGRPAESSEPCRARTAPERSRGTARARPGTTPAGLRVAAHDQRNHPHDPMA